MSKWKLSWQYVFNTELKHHGFISLAAIETNYGWLGELLELRYKSNPEYMTIDTKKLCEKTLMSVNVIDYEKMSE